MFLAVSHPMSGKLPRLCRDKRTTGTTRSPLRTNKAHQKVPVGTWQRRYVVESLSFVDFSETLARSESFENPLTAIAGDQRCCRQECERGIDNKVGHQRVPVFVRETDLIGEGSKEDGRLWLALGPALLEQGHVLNDPYPFGIVAQCGQPGVYRNVYLDVEWMVGETVLCRRFRISRTVFAGDMRSLVPFGRGDSRLHRNSRRAGSRTNVNLVDVARRLPLPLRGSLS